MTKTPRTRTPAAGNRIKKNSPLVSATQPPRASKHQPPPPAFLPNSDTAAPTSVRTAARNGAKTGASKTGAAKTGASNLGASSWTGASTRTGVSNTGGLRDRGVAHKAPPAAWDIPSWNDAGASGSPVSNGASGASSAAMIMGSRGTKKKNTDRHNGNGDWMSGVQEVDISNSRGKCQSFFCIFVGMITNLCSSALLLLFTAL